MLSSGKIELSEIAAGEANLENVWGGVFCHSTFVRLASDALNLRGNVFAVMIGCEPVGAASLLWRNRSLFKAATLPLLFQYSGPVFFEPPPSGFALQFDEALSGLCDFAYLSFPPFSEFPKTLPPDWTIVPMTTPVLLAADLKTWGSRFGDDVKNKLNKASRAKVEIERTDSLPTGLWEGAFSRRGMKPPIAPEKLAQWCRGLIDTGLLRVFTARIGDKAVAFRGELVHGRYAYDWIAGSDPEHHSTGANQLLMAEIGRELSGLGLEAWDLVGGGGAKSISDFKKSFGAKELPYFQAYRSFGIKGHVFASLRKMRHG